MIFVGGGIEEHKRLWNDKGGFEILAEEKT